MATNSREHDPSMVADAINAGAEVLGYSPLPETYLKVVHAVLDAVADDIARAERERVLAEVEALHPKVPLYKYADDCPEVDGHEHDEDEDGDPICRTCGVQGYRCGLCKDWDGVGVKWPCEHGALVARLRGGEASPCACGHQDHVHDRDAVPTLCMICGDDRSCSGRFRESEGS